MAKRRPKGRSLGSSNRVKRELQRAALLFSEGRPEEALDQLLLLQQRYPRSLPTLRMILDICIELDDWTHYLFYGILLLSLERDKVERINLLNNVVLSCQKLELAFLCEKYGRLLLAEPVDKDTAGRMEGFLQIAEPLLAAETSKVEALLGLSKAESLKLLHEHEWCRFLVEHEFVDEARPLLAELAAKAPQYIPVQNNLTMVLFLDGDLEKALSSANQVLSIDPYNYHALGNLSRIHFFKGNMVEARAAADRLLQVQNASSDLPFKKIETLIFLAADQEILNVYQGLQRKKGVFGLAQIQMAVATAHYRLGDEKAARKMWRLAARHDSTGIAASCLEERELQPGERNVPWYVPFDGWFLRDLDELVAGSFDEEGQVKSIRQFNRALEKFVQRQPALLDLLPHMLAVGDQRSRVFATMLCKHLNTVETATTLRDFGQSPYGSDQLRMDALLFVADNFPELLPENRHVKKWINGKQQEIVILNYSITFEPGPLDFPPHIHDRYEEAYELMSEGEFAAAEPILSQLIADVPDFRSAYSGLLATYKTQKRTEEADRLAEEMFARFPDYFFARTAMSERLLAQGKVAEARQMVAPLLSMKELHISEFRALANVYMDLSLRDDHKEEARSWLSYWEAVEPDHPMLGHWRIELADMQGLLGLLLKKLDLKG